MIKARTLQVLLVEDGRPARILAERPLPTGGGLGVALREGDELAGELAELAETTLVDVSLGGEEAGAALRMMRGAGGDGEVVMVYDEAPAQAEEDPGGEPGGQVYDFLTRPLGQAELRRYMGESGDSGISREDDGGGDDGSVRGKPTVHVAGIVGSSPALLELLGKVERVAAGSASVLIQGETGTGKSLVARALHEGSRRRERPFVVVNCSAFQDQLLESELFGHEKGAFTGAVAAKQGLFEVADGGTLFLDEVAEMSPAMQAKLLQVLDDGELRRVGGTHSRRVDVRVISATNRDLGQRVERGEFRRDLLFRLNVINLEVPPLHRRREDIQPLVDHFLGRFRSPGGSPKMISPAALRLLTEYRWPGNVRELVNTLEGMVLLSPGPVIGTADLPATLRPAVDFELAERETPLPMSEIERQHIERTLRYTEGKKAPAARLLGIDVKTLYNKLKGYAVEV